MCQRIAIVLPDLGIGGAERVSLDLAREFIRLGHQVDLVLMRKAGGLVAEVPADAKIFDLNVGQLRNIGRPLARYLGGRAPAAVLANLGRSQRRPCWSRGRSASPGHAS